MDIKTNNWKTKNGHTVKYTQTTEWGFFARRSGSSTVYVCECGKQFKHSGPARKSQLDNHDSWLTIEEQNIVSAEFRKALNI